MKKKQRKPVYLHEVMQYQGKLKGLKGEEFQVGGRIAGAIPPVGTPGAILFEILGEYPGQNPPWADISIDDLKARINPDICEPPYFRLFDCVRVAAKERESLPLFETGEMARIMLPPVPHPDAQAFVFFRAFRGQVTMIDTEERIRRHECEQPDAPHRHRGFK